MKSNDLSDMLSSWVKRKGSTKMKQLTAIIITMMILINTGCTVVSMAQGKSIPELKSLQPGKTRVEVERTLGLWEAPRVNEWTTTAGVRCCKYVYYAGRTPSKLYATQALIMDIFLIGMLELIRAIPSEKAASNDPNFERKAWGGKDATVNVCYDKKDKVLGLFNELDVIPPDGKSGAYAWPLP